MSFKKWPVLMLKRMPLLVRTYHALRWRILAAAQLETKSLLETNTRALQAEADRLNEAILVLQADLAKQAASLHVHETLILDQISGKAAQRNDANHGFLISVVLPTFNRGHCISDAITSVCCQSYQNWELLVVDDGSTDNTSDVVTRFVKDDLRIKFVTQSHRGQSAARNHGIRVSKGDVICYLDSDNTFYPSYLDAVASAFSKDANLSVTYAALVIEHHGETRKIQFEPFDRKRLLVHNFIDMNAIAHRRNLVSLKGDFDESLDRLADWDLILRFTQDIPGQLPTIAAKYRVLDECRVTSVNNYGFNNFKIQRKWAPSIASPTIRILYVVWHYPQLSESYIETEIRVFLRLGAQVEIWRQAAPASAYAASIRIHEGDIRQAVGSFDPHVIHVHWLGFALANEGMLAQINRPVTVRLHGFEVTHEALDELLRRPWVSRVYAFPHQTRLIATGDPRVRSVRSVFDTTLFAPENEKDRRMILRTAAALESKDLEMMFELAKSLPDFRVVLAVVTCNERERYAHFLRDYHRDERSRVELLFDVQRPDIAQLVKSAGIYVQTARRPGEAYATPIGMPVGIAEAMATGCFVVAPDLPEFAKYLAGTNVLYRDFADAVKQIESTRSWTDRQWRKAWIQSIDLAYARHADEIELADMLNDLRGLSAVKG